MNKLIQGIVRCILDAVDRRRLKWPRIPVIIRPDDFCLRRARIATTPSARLCASS